MKQKSASGVNGPVTASGVSLGLQNAWSAPVVTEGDRAVNRDFWVFKQNSLPVSPTLRHFTGCPWLLQ